jgi:hypothetical protein
MAISTEDFVKQNDELPMNILRRYHEPATPLRRILRTMQLRQGDFSLRTSGQHFLAREYQRGTDTTEL